MYARKLIGSTWPKAWKNIAVTALGVSKQSYQPLINLGSSGSTTFLQEQPVVQDYFTKWADAFSLPDQTAEHITEELVRLFSTMGIPDILHSDQGRNLTLKVFYSGPHWKPLVFIKLAQQHTTPREMVWFLHAYRTSTHLNTSVMHLLN